MISMSVSQTATSSTPIFDSNTDQTTHTLTTSEPARRYALHSGSTSDGAFALDLTAVDTPTGLGDELGAVIIRRGLLTALDRSQQPIPGTRIGLHAALGTTNADPLSVMGGLVADQLPGAGEQSFRGTAQANVTSVVTNGAVTTITTATTDSETGAASTTQRRIYHRRNGKYVLQEMSLEGTDTVEGVQVERQVRMQFANVTWSRGFSVEAASASTMAAAASPWGPDANLTPAPCTDPDVCGTPGNPSGGASDCAPPPLTAGGANVVYVHGINADGDAWGSPTSNSAVRGSNRCDLRIANDLAPSLTAGGIKGLGRHSDQAIELRSDVMASGLNDLIFVGHSQGGLISRRAAQSLQGTDGGTPVRTIRGVVTTGTPHLGARLANQASLLGLPGRVVRIFTGGYACRVTSQCPSILQAVSALEESLPDAVLSSHAMLDLRPSSSAITAVNAPPERFRRFAIQNALTAHGFLFFQVAGDVVPGNRGRAVREVATAVAVVALATAVVAGIVSIFAPWAAVTAARAATVFAAIVGTNLMWASLTYGNNRSSDGVVENPSQAYPPYSLGTFAPVSRQSLDPSSHTAQIDSRRSAEDIQRTLTQELNVQER